MPITRQYMHPSCKLSSKGRLTGIRKKPRRGGAAKLGKLSGERQVIGRGPAALGMSMAMVRCATERVGYFDDFCNCIRLVCQLRPDAQIRKAFLHIDTPSGPSQLDDLW